MEKENKLLTEILKISTKYKLPATSVYIDYYNYRTAGLKHNPTIQYLNMIYLKNVKEFNNYEDYIEKEYPNYST